MTFQGGTAFPKYQFAAGLPIGRLNDLDHRLSNLESIPITATGTIDDANTVFTMANTPRLMVINGGLYAKTGGAITWTLSGLTVTLSSAVGTGGAIFGI